MLNLNVFQDEQAFFTTVQNSIKSMLFALRPRPVCHHSVPSPFYEVVNTRSSLVWLLNAMTLLVDLLWTSKAF